MSPKTRERNKSNKGTELTDLFSPLTQRLLESRGITQMSGAQAFFSPDYERHTHNPFLLKDMDKAVERIQTAIKKDEHICIYSDYDMDGIPGAVIFHDFFKEIGYEKIMHYIPHRNTEGFGLNKDAIDELKNKDVHLIITIDCGIAHSDEVAYANKKGIDVIITDHHLPHAELPPAHAILNPKQPECDYPFKDLCGAAVAFKLIQALIDTGVETEDFDITEGWEKWLLDMVGMATLSDMVPLAGENRVFAYYGLLVLRKSRRPGLKALLKRTGARQRYLTEEDVGFSIGPRINAASRMDHPMDAFNLLSTNDEEEAERLAEHLEHINNERKGVVASMVKEAKKKIEARNALNPVLVIGNPEWKPGLLGLISNSLVTSYNRPVFVWGREGAEVLKGSCRSEGKSHLLEIMQNVEEGVFIEYGGHAFSGGFSLSVENVHTLEEKLTLSFQSLDMENAHAAVYTPDHTLTPEEVSWQLFDEVNRFAPFGEGNPKPLFEFKDAHITRVEQFGKTKNHLKLILNDVLEAIAFFSHPESYEKMPIPGKSATVLGHIEKNTFGRGKPSLRVRIVDIV